MCVARDRVEDNGFHAVLFCSFGMIRTVVTFSVVIPNEDDP